MPPSLCHLLTYPPFLSSLKVFFHPIAESQVLNEEELNKVKVNWDELISCSTELLKYVFTGEGGGPAHWTHA